LWQASRTSTKKITLVSPLVFTWIKSKQLVPSTFYVDHGGWRPGHDVQYFLSSHGFQGPQASNTINLLIDNSSNMRQHAWTLSEFAVHCPWVY
jgi:hypothetical protein